MSKEAELPQKRTSMFAQCAIMTGTYAFLGLAFSAAIQASPVALIVVAALAASTFQVAVCFSVFGPGPYWLRLFYSHGFAAAVLIAMLCGMLLNFAAVQSTASEIIIFLSYGILFAFPASVAGQIPYWICRGFGGWQLVPAGGQPWESFSIRDLLVLTVLCGLAFSAPRLVTDISNSLDPDLIRIPETESNSATLETAEGRAREARELNLEIAGMVAIGAFVTSLIGGLPIAFMTFRPKENHQGCVWMFIYVACVWLIFNAVAVLFLGAPVFSEPVFFLLLFFGGALLTLWMPLSMLRLAGFRLVTPTLHGVEPEWDPDTASWPKQKSSNELR